MDLYSFPSLAVLSHCVSDCELIKAAAAAAAASSF